MDVTAIPLSLYVHWPWCLQKCPYCDNGYVVSNEHRIMALREKLVKALSEENVSALLVGLNPEIADALFTTRMLS